MLNNAGGVVKELTIAAAFKGIALAPDAAADTLGWLESEALLARLGL